MQMVKPQKVSAIQDSAYAHLRRRVLRHFCVAADVGRGPIVGHVDDGRLGGLAVEVDDSEDSLGNFGGGGTLKLLFF